MNRMVYASRYVAAIALVLLAPAVAFAQSGIRWHGKKHLDGQLDF